MNILLLFTQEELGNLLAHSLSSFFDTNTILAPTAAAAEEAIITQSPALVIGDLADIASFNIATTLKQKKIPAALLKRSENNTAALAALGLEQLETFSEANFLQEVSNVLRRLGAVQRNELVASESIAMPFFRVGTPLLLKTSPLLSDVYIKLKELKYLKIFQKGDAFTKEDLDRYLHQKQIQFFYVKQEDAPLVTQHLGELIAQLLQQSPLPQKLSTPVVLSTTETIHDLVRQVGVTPEVQTLIKNNVALVVTEMGKTPTLGEILGRMEKNKEKYIASHSHMLAGISCMLAAALEWGSEVSFKKLTMAALLHDMCFSNEILCRVKSMEELTKRREEFTLADVQEYKSHPRRAAVLVQGMKEVPADVDRIVHQHHELPAGSGFPEALSAINIHPLATALIAGHEMVDWILDHDGAFDPEAFCESRSETYKAGHFKQILRAIRKIELVIS